MTATTISSWSFSRLAVFEQCAYRARLQWLDKVPDTTPKPAADRGTTIHSEAEDYVKDPADSNLPPSLRKFRPDFESLRTRYREGLVLLEGEWGFDREWRPVDWRAAWLRLKCDAVIKLSDTALAVVDFKTGSRFGNEVKHLDQLMLYAVTALLRYPQIEHVTVEDWYLDQDERSAHSMTRKQMGRHLPVFDKRGRAMTTETRFKPNPNLFTCKYCPYSPDKQGDCKFGVSAPKTVGKPIAMPTKIINKPSATDHLF